MQTFPCPENFLKRLNNSHSSGGVTWGERGKGGGCGCNRSAFCKIVSFWEKVFPFMNLYTVHLASLSLLLLSRVFLDPFAATWVMFKDHILLIDRVKRNRPLLWPPHTVINLNDHSLIFIVVTGHHSAMIATSLMSSYRVLIIKSFDSSLK